MGGKKPENAASKRSSSRRSDEITLLQRDLSIALSNATGLDEILRLCLQAAIEVSGLDGGGIYLRDEKSGELRLACHCGLSPEFVNRVACYSAEAPNVQLSMAGRAVYLRLQELDTPDAQDLSKLDGITAVAIVPISHRNEVIACLNVASHRLEEVPPVRRSALETVAGQMGGAIARAKAEERLRESEERYRRLFHECTAGILVHEFGPQGPGRILEANDVAVSLLGYSREELSRMTPLDLQAPDARRDVSHLRERVLRGEAVAFEWVAAAKDGRKVPLEIHIKPFTWQGGLRALAQVTDITERKRAENELRAEAEFRRVVMQRAAEGLCVCHQAPEYPYLRFTVWNERMEQITGYTMEEINRRGWHQTLYPDPELQAKLVARMARVVQGDDLEADEREIVRADGARRQLQISTSVIQDETGRSHVLGLIHDVTERKRADDALRRSEERFRALAEDMPLLICRFRPDTTIIYVNPPCAAYFASTAAELEGTSFLRLIPEAERERVLAGISSVTVDSPVQSHEHQVIAPGGEVRWQRWTNRGLFDDQGRIVAYQAIGEDVTERRRTEEAIRRSEKMRAEAEKLAATGRMAAQVAHEINNPLAGIRNAFRLVRHAVPEDHPDRDMVERIEREIARIADIVRHMYTLYSPQPPRETRVVVADAIRDILMMLEPLRREHEVGFDTTGLSPQLSVALPEGGFQQIVYNLVINAIEASPPGEAIQIVARLADNSRDIVEITVSDKGRGIPAEIAARIFEPFFTSKTASDATTGLGMGLSMVKSIVEGAGGRIEFESPPGEGTVFRVFLPRSAGS